MAFGLSRFFGIAAGGTATTVGNGASAIRMTSKIGEDVGWEAVEEEGNSVGTS